MLSVAFLFRSCRERIAVFDSFSGNPLLSMRRLTADGLTLKLVFSGMIRKLSNMYFETSIATAVDMIFFIRPQPHHHGCSAAAIFVFE